MQQANDVYKQQIFALKEDLSSNPRDPQILFRLCLLYLHQNNHLESLKYLERAIDFCPDDPQFYNVKGVLLINLNRPEEAKAAFVKSYELNPEQAEVCINLGTFALRTHAFQEAILYFEKALDINPNAADAYNNLATVYMVLNQQVRGYEYILKAIELSPDHPLAKFNWAKLEKHFGHIVKSREVLENLLEKDPMHLNAKAELADVRRIQNQDKEALALIDEVLQLLPQHPNANHYAGLIYYNKGNWEKAQQYFQVAYQNSQPSMFMLGMIGHCQLALGDWSGWRQTRVDAKQILDANAPFEPINPFIGQALFPDLADYHKICKVWGQYFNSKSLAPRYPRINYQHKRLRIGYISPNFTVHPVGLQINNLFKYHNKEKFEIYCFPTKVHKTPLYYEICKHSDHVIELDEYAFEQSAEIIRSHEIDILVDLAGPTDNHCYDLLARQPAPVQCHMLGATGTLGTSFIQYIITTKSIVDDKFLPYYSEVPVRLPETEIARHGFEMTTEPVSRKDWGLPEDKVVMLAYHNFYRIDEETWATWMEILRQADNTVIWVKVPNESFLNNLLEKTKKSGIDPSRIIPCYEKTLTQRWQHQAADFLIDSLTFTSGTCIFLSQWAGLPVLTCEGPSPQARVGASFCRASNVLEQVVESKADYVIRAVSWANSPEKIKALKEKLLSERHHSPLFSPERYMQHLERAYQAMWQDFTNDEHLQVIDID